MSSHAMPACLTAMTHGGDDVAYYHQVRRRVPAQERRGGLTGGRADVRAPHLGQVGGLVRSHMTGIEEGNGEMAVGRLDRAGLTGGRADVRPTDLGQVGGFTMAMHPHKQSVTTIGVGIMSRVVEPGGWQNETSNGLAACTGASPRPTVTHLALNPPRCVHRQADGRPAVTRQLLEAAAQVRAHMVAICHAYISLGHL